MDVNNPQVSGLRSYSSFPPMVMFIYDPNTGVSGAYRRAQTTDFSSVVGAGTASATNQVTEIARLSSIDSKLGASGQTGMAQSWPVTIAIDQAPFPVYALQSGVWTISTSAPTGGASLAGQASGNALLQFISGKSAFGITGSGGLPVQVVPSAGYYAIPVIITSGGGSSSISQVGLTGTTGLGLQVLNSAGYNAIPVIITSGGGSSSSSPQVGLTGLNGIPITNYTGSGISLLGVAIGSGTINVAITGTQSVAVTNLNSIQTAQSGIWSVGLTGNNTVSIANLNSIQVTPSGTFAVISSPNGSFAVAITGNPLVSIANLQSTIGQSGTWGVQLTGTNTIAISNLQSIQVTPSGSFPVAITGTPTIGINQVGPLSANVSQSGNWNVAVSNLNSIFVGQSGAWGLGLTGTGVVPSSMNPCKIITGNLQNNATGVGFGSIFNTSGLASVMLNIQGPFTGIINLEDTLDGNNWGSTSTVVSGLFSSQITNTGFYLVNVGGVSAIRANIISYSSGNISIDARGTPVPRIFTTVKVGAPITAMVAQSGVWGMQVIPSGTFQVAITGNPQVSISNLNSIQVSPSGSFAVAITGSPTINIGNLNSISAIQSGTWTVTGTQNQGTPNVTANAWPTKITDGTNIASVTAGTGIPTTGNPALIVAMSPLSSFQRSLLAAGTSYRFPTTNASIDHVLTSGIKGISVVATTSDAYFQYGINAQTATTGSAYILAGERLDWDTSIYTGVHMAVIYGDATVTGLIHVTELF